MHCFCGSKREFSHCCQPVLATQSSTSPEQLMRSRFSAYCSKNIDYLVQTWHPSQRALNSAADIAAFASQAHFVQLQVIQSTLQTPEIFKQPVEPTHGASSVGYVEFVARFIQAEKLHQLHEISRFVQEHGRWYYLDGELLPSTSQKIGRNDLCPCQSGKKYKQCTVHQGAH